MMMAVLVSSLSILIMQVKKKNDDDGSQAGNVYVCPSALLATAKKYIGGGKSVVHCPICIYTYMCMHKSWLPDFTL